MENGGSLFSFMLDGTPACRSARGSISFSGSKYDDCCSNNDASVRGWAVRVYVPVVPVQIVERNPRAANSESKCMLSRTAHRLEMSSPSAHLNRTSSPTSGPIPAKNAAQAAPNQIPNSLGVRRHPHPHVPHSHADDTFI